METIWCFLLCFSLQKSYEPPDLLFTFSYWRPDRNIFFYVHTSVYTVFVRSLLIECLEWCHLYLCSHSSSKSGSKRFRYRPLKWTNSDFCSAWNQKRNCQTSSISVNTSEIRYETLLKVVSILVCFYVYLKCEMFLLWESFVFVCMCALIHFETTMSFRNN